MKIKPSWWQPIRPPKIDPSSIGVTFVDVLFALTVGKLLDAAAGGELTPTAIAHLSVGAVLTIASWVGYHNSVNRVRYFLRFWNLPTALFLIDVALVCDYWLVPVTVQNEMSGDSQPSAFWTTLLVAIAAFLYVAWDLVALRIRKSDKYRERPDERDIPGRRYASFGLLTVAVGLLAIVCCTQPHTTAPIIWVDVALVLSLLGYRTVKERVTPPEALSSSADLALVVKHDQIEALRSLLKTLPQS